MTVNELIAGLQALVADDPLAGALPVIADGCDCWGEAARVRVIDRSGGWSEPALLVERKDNVR